MNRLVLVLVSLALAGGLFVLASQHSAQAEELELASIEQLGKLIFFDASLSVNGKQSCAACHGPDVGFTGPDAAVNASTVVYQGAIVGRFGDRKPPASSYAGDSPVLHYDEEAYGWFGGMFWDGRATGWTLGDPLAEQAQGPFLNPLEQAMPDARLVAVKISKSDYAGLFEEVWGPGSLDFARDVAGTYERIARSIAAYERSAESDRFSSKFDQFWVNAADAGKNPVLIKFSGGGMGPGGGGGMGGGGADPNRWQNFRNLGLSDQELQGLAAFNDPSRANCASCHSLEPGAAGYPLFTDFGYDNVGMPKNPGNPFYSMPPKWNPAGMDWVDVGLGGFLKSAGFAPDVYEPEMGKFKVPSLRNVDLRPSADFVKAYGHNGFFKSLEDIVMFYAWRGMPMNGGLGMGGMGGGMDCGNMGGGGMGPGGGGMGGGMGDGMMMCDPDLFPAPEYGENLTPMNHFNMMDQANIVAFLKTLSDGYFER